MELMEYVKIVFAVIVAAIGWLVTHYYTSKRDVSNSRRQSRIEALSIAYKAFVRAGIEGKLVTRGDDGKISNRAGPVEDAIALVHLYGNVEQSKLASKCARQFEETGGAIFNELVDALRKDIREMLDESDVTDPPIYLRISLEAKKKQNDK